MNITVHALSRSTHESFGESVPKETAILISSILIHPSLAEVLPNETTLITPLTSVNADNRHTYRVRVFGYTIQEFITIVEAYSDGLIDLALEFTSQIRPIVPVDEEDYEG